MIQFEDGLGSVHEILGGLICEACSLRRSSPGSGPSNAGCPQNRLPPVDQLHRRGTGHPTGRQPPAHCHCGFRRDRHGGCADVHEHATNLMRIALMTQSPPPIEPANLIVLHIRSRAPVVRAEETARRRAPVARAEEDVTLFSGAVIRVLSTDISDVRLAFLRTELSQAVSAEKAAPATASAGSMPRSAADPPLASEAVAIIRITCEKEWPDDFRMRAYCQTRQEGVAALRQRPMTVSPAHITIRTKCATEWPTDFRMRNFCEEQQLKALAVIR